MGKALYRRYRSTSFDEVIGQDHITTTLKNALKSKSFAHAYLLTGPKGVGKTSIARILAFAVNGLEYAHEVNHLDIIEIDAASNRRIDEIRALRERVHIAPTSAPHKVYIIDEVHMLTREAFNALLKTLEEPPEHAIFILATTDIHKVPDTIVSRCVRFTFRPIEPEAIVKHLAMIAKNEKLTIDEGALGLIAQHSGGSFRDSISLLEQIKNIGGNIDKHAVEQMLGVASSEIVESVLGAVAAGSIQALDTAIDQAYRAGTSETTLAKQIATQLRSELASGSLRLSRDETMSILRSLLNVPGSPNPRAELELTLMGVALGRSPMQELAPVPAKPTSKPKVPEPEDTPPIEALTPEPPVDEPMSEESIAEPVDIPMTEMVKEEIQLWESVLEQLKKKHNTLYGIARMAEVKHDGDTLELNFRFAFHYKQMNDAKSKTILSNVLTELGSSHTVLVMNVAASAGRPAAAAVPKTELSTISNIFGSHEVLES